METLSRRGDSGVRATIKQIAERSGLSVPTVSRILSDKGQAHQPATRERVLQAARELGYRPNTSAQAMRRGRFGAIALLQSGTDRVRSLLDAGLLGGILDATAERELHLTVAALADAKLTDQGYMPKILREWAADGLLINYNAEIPERMVDLIARHEIPAVWINSVQESDCIYPDDERAAQEATEHLLRLGHERIVFASNQQTSHYSYAARQRGYEAAMHAAGRVPRSLITGNIGTSPPDPARSGEWRIMLDDLPGPDRATALVAYNTETVRAVLYLAAAAGVGIPRDLSLIGFCLSTKEATAIREVDTMVLPQYLMGREAVPMLLDKIEAPDVPLAPRPMPHTFAGGWTTAPPLRPGP
jgi:LacI family transcriptional regulator